LSAIAPALWIALMCDSVTTPFAGGDSQRLRYLLDPFALSWARASKAAWRIDSCLEAAALPIDLIATFCSSGAASAYAATSSTISDSTSADFLAARALSSSLAFLENDDSAPHALATKRNSTKNRITSPRLFRTSADTRL